ncbi:TrmH family RNA methyltransferase [Aquirhabdus parva]|uniref:RNA methyltransferase n=1 Tax=Aquirhabdus parva TaxID=2283318 RepID=A0A345P654_9GAMM|nr:RNA methyltransferase [Aquirhabdus parva]AXI02763.1 RNA methyltransferase [Aquirhabdus parva]
MLPEKPFLPITSRDNPRLKHLRGLLEHASVRRKSSQTVLEGIHLLDAYQRAGKIPDSIFIAESAQTHPEANDLLDAWPSVARFILPDALYKEMRTLGQGIDIMALIDTAFVALPEQLNTDVLILEDVQDAGNVGTLLRTAAAAGIKQVICTKGTALVWSPRVLRAGMGAQFGIQVIEHADIKEILERLTIPLHATSSHANQSLYALNLKTPIAWLMGNEGQGASQIALENAISVSIPQPGGQESLNVAVAGAVCMFEMVRQRLI